jgi:lipopolysaccharide/colanic/teichoic acid biosynthesis glycosyltransferase
MLPYLNLVTYSYPQKRVGFTVADKFKIESSETPSLIQDILQLLHRGFIIREYTQVYESNTYRIPIQHFDTDFYRYFPFSRSNTNQLYLSFVKILEIIGSILGVIATLFLIPFVALGNALGNKGSLFYSQIRVGKNGILIKIYKFRTMKSDAENNGAAFCIKDDIRVTPFGKFMRKTRIDEFPQFINILKGEMAIIGPRPERPVFVAELVKVMPFYETRHVVKPGLTGWAQVNYSYGESIEESLIKLQYDLYYIKHRSILLDLNIVIKTLSTVLFYRGQ